MSYRVRLLPFALALCLAGPAVSAAEGMAHGETSQTRPAAPLAWRGAAYHNQRSIEMTYDAMPTERLLRIGDKTA